MNITVEYISSGGQVRLQVVGSSPKFQVRLQVVGSSPKFQVTLNQVVRVHTTITYILCYTQLLIKLLKLLKL